jgi:hypothetical protein
MNGRTTTVNARSEPTIRTAPIARAAASDGEVRP